MALSRSTGTPIVLLALAAWASQALAGLCFRALLNFCISSASAEHNSMNNCRDNPKFAFCSLMLTETQCLFLASIWLAELVPNCKLFNKHKNYFLFCSINSSLCWSLTVLHESIKTNVNVLDVYNSNYSTCYN